MAECSEKATTPVANKVAPKFDFSGIDPSTIDPDRIPLGTGQQDCSQIAQIFERGAHTTPSEAAVFSTLTRGIQNNKHFSLASANSLKTYLAAPSEAAASAAKQADTFTSAPTQSGTVAPTDHIMQSLNIGTQKQAANTGSFGDKLMNFARDCIPCNLRLLSFLEMHPHVDLLGVMDAWLEGNLGMLSDITGMLTNFDIYADFCALLDLLSFMCIPDLQKMIALLMALFMLQTPKLDGLIGMLSILIMPIFAPILMAITSLLDQFSLLVTGPLDCVVDAMNAQLEKLNIETENVSFKIESIPTKQLEALSGGLKQLNIMIQEGIQEVRNKLGFYIGQVKAMLAEVGGGDTAYIQMKIKVLQLIRMMSFITAIIGAISKGHAACSSRKTPEKEELDSFFNNFLNPNSPFNMWIEDGEIHIDEKVPVLSSDGIVVQFDGTTLLDLSVKQQVTSIATQLSQPTRAVIPCRLETSAEDVSKVNEWIAELNKS